MKIAIWALVCICGCATAGAGAAEDAEVGSLKVEFRIAEKMHEGAIAWIVLLRDGRSVGKEGTRFEKEVVFTNLVPGEYHVRVVPWFNGQRWGRWGSASATVTANAEKRVTVDLAEAGATGFEAKILGLEGNALVGRGVRVIDVTAGEFGTSHEIETDAKGVLVFHGYVGRKYRLEVGLILPPIVRFRSEVVEVKEEAKQNSMTWRLKLGPHIEVRFFRKAGDKTVPFAEMKTIGVFTEKGGMSVGLRDGVLILQRDSRLLAGASRVTLRITGDGGAEEYEIVENGTFELLADADKQIVDVVLAKPSRAGLQVVPRGIRSGDVISTQLYIWEERSGKYLGSSASDHALSLQAARYLVKVWAYGYRIREFTVEVKGVGTQVAEVPLTEAATMGVRVKDSEGRAIGGALVRVYYDKLPFLARQFVRCDQDGAARVSVDQSQGPVIAVYSEGFAPEVRQVSSEAEVGPLEITMGHEVVRGKVQVMPGVVNAEKCGLVWADARWPRLPIAVCPIVDGGFEVRLGEGEYVRVLVFGEYAIPLDRVTASGEAESTLPGVSVGDTAGAKRKAWGDVLDR